MAWRLASSLITLRAEANAMWPGRSKRSDGTIGDSAHQGRQSDHNPNTAGVVTAFDITHDPASGASMHTLTEWLRLRQDRRIKYVIWNRRMYSAYSTASRRAWQWGAYLGSNAHTTHAHVSVSADHRLYDDMASWQLGDDMAFTPQEEAQLRALLPHAAELAHYVNTVKSLGSNPAGLGVECVELHRALDKKYDPSGNN